MRLSLAVVFFLLVHAAWIPWAAFRSRKMLVGAGAPPRIRIYAGVLYLQVVLGLVAWGVGRAEGIELFPPRTPAMTQGLLAAGILAALLAVIRPYWRRSVDRDDPRIQLFAPRTGDERSLWVVVSLAAGVSEEMNYRGVLFAILRGLSGSAVAGALGSAALFGLAHIFQSRRSVAIITLIALLMQALAWWSGSLYLPMAVHALYDIVAGFAYARLIRAREAAAVA